MIQKARGVRKRTVTRTESATRAATNQRLIENWMSKPVVTVRPRDSVAHARRLLEQHRINQLPVVMDRTLVGIVTDRDLRNASDTMAVSGRAARAPLGRADIIPENIVVETVMSANVMTLKPTDSVAEAANLMHRERIGGIPVIEGKRVAGIMTRSDVLKAFIALSGAKG
jgi:acetoin utilization protein AcuB